MNKSVSYIRQEALRLYPYSSILKLYLFPPSFCCWSLDSALLTLPMPACGSKFIRKTGIITDTFIKFLKEYYLQVILILFHQLHNITIKYYYL